MLHYILHTLFIALFTPFPASGLTAAANIIFKNHCNYPIYIWEVYEGYNPRDDEHSTVLAHGELALQATDHGGPTRKQGVSLKLNHNPIYSAQPIAQFEYDLAPEKGLIQYDLSLIDCHYHQLICPNFIYEGVYLHPSPAYALPASSPICPRIYCDASDCPESQVYLYDSEPHPSPNWACTENADLILETCVGNGRGRELRYGGEGVGGGQGAPYQGPDVPAVPAVPPAEEVPYPQSGYGALGPAPVVQQKPPNRIITVDLTTGKEIIPGGQQEGKKHGIIVVDLENGRRTHPNGGAPGRWGGA